MKKSYLKEFNTSLTQKYKSRIQYFMQNNFCHDFFNKNLEPVWSSNFFFSKLRKLFSKNCIWNQFSKQNFGMICVWLLFLKQVFKNRKQKNFFFFFLIGNEKILLRKKEPTRVHWRCTVGAKIKNQNHNDQVKQEEKNKNNATKPHSKQGEYAWRKT